MIASVLRLNRKDVKALKMSDSYSIHRVVYDLFDDIRTDTQKIASNSSGILYAENGGDRNGYNILILTNRKPNQPKHGEIESKVIVDGFLKHKQYRFEVVVNPTKRDIKTKKTVAVRGENAIIEWFVQRGLNQWGFDTHLASLQINNVSVQTFIKKANQVTLGTATLRGVLNVIDQEKFIKSFQNGVGRGRAFGFGLLQIVPIINSFDS